MRLKVFPLFLTLIGSILFIPVPNANATNITFSQTFNQGAIASSSVIIAWESFRSSLTGSYGSFTWSSTNGSSITVSDPTKIQLLANALRTGTVTNSVIGSNTWYVGTGCGSTSGYSVAVEFSNVASCSCSSTYSLRPLINNSNWGGSGGTTCGAATQTITLTFYNSAPDTTAPTFTSSLFFSAAENISISTAAATIKVSESATVTISSGADAALFTISNSDTVTALIKFKASPNYEAPSDSGGNNVYDLVLTATDSASNAGTQTITITVTDVVDTSSFNSFSLSGTPAYRTVATITANVSVAARVTFRAKNVIISGCKNKLATGSGSSFSATCSWKPSTRGAVVLTATAAPTGAGISSSTATPLSVMVGNRSGGR